MVPPLTGLVFSCGLVAADLIIRSTVDGTVAPRRWDLKEAGVYLVGIVWSLATWGLLAVWCARLGKRARRLAAFGIAISVGSLCAASFVYLVSFEQAASWQVLNFALAEPRHVMILAAWGLKIRGMLAMIVLPILTFVALGVPELEKRIGDFKNWHGALLGAGYAGLSALVFAGPGFQSPLPVDTNVATAFAQYLIAATGRVQHLSTPIRPAIPEQPHVWRPNVLLLVHESLRADAVFSGFDYRPSGLDARVVSPYSSRLAERRADGYFVFKYARTDSTATESSVPAILSGLELGGESRAFGRAQSFWALGKAAYLHTFLFSALDYEWSHFDEYFLDQHVDLAVTGRDISREIVNDTGIDDGLVVDRAIEHLKRLASEKRAFAGVVHFNGTHMPGYPGPGVSAPEAKRGDSSRYGLAVRYIDRLVERLDLALDRLGLSETTVVISTSDHGENLVPARPPDRLGSYYDETVRIPFWIRLPLKLRAERPELVATLDDWRERNVQNSDILPTVRDLIRLADDRTVLAPVLPGRSLIRPAPAEDTLSGQSTCAFRVWGLEGFFVIHGKKKIIVGTDQPRPRLFDLTTDPREEHDLWDDEAQRAQALPWFEQKVRQGEERRKLCARLRACPLKQL